MKIIFFNLKVSDKNNLNRHTLKPHKHIRIMPTIYYIHFLYNLLIFFIKINIKRQSNVGTMHIRRFPWSCGIVPIKRE